MGVLMVLLYVLLAVFLILGILLCIAFVRLGRELKKLGDDTESLIVRMQRTTQTVQVAIPLIALAKQAGEALLARRDQLMKRKK